MNYLQPLTDLHGPFLVSIFNHKGGVGKTSTSIALGWKLAEYGYKVLIVDADMQCNVTGFLVDPGMELLSSNDQDDLADIGFSPLGEYYRAFPDVNITSALCSVFDHPTAIDKGVKPFELPPTEVFQVRERQNLLPEGYAIKSNLLIEPPESLYLLAANPELGKLDTRMTLACEHVDMVPGNENMIGAVYQLLMRTARKHKFKYIIVDLSPASNTFNKVLVMSSHFLITPCSPDYSSLMAIEALSDMFPEWTEWMRKKSAVATRKNATLTPPLHQPVYLGYTIQLYTVTNTGAKLPAKAFQCWINRIASAVQNRLIPKLNQVAMAAEPGMYPQLPAPACLAMIRNFQSACPASNQAHVPVFSLTGPVVRTITKSTHALEVVEDAHRIFEEFANKFTSTWPNIPANSRKSLLRLQWAYNVIHSANFDVPKTPTDIIALADKITFLRR